jgi:hypothetical protein
MSTSHFHRLIARAITVVLVPALAACLDSGPSAADGAAQLYQPSFSGNGGSASNALAGVGAPLQMTCRFTSATGRVECDPLSLDGVTYRASYQFVDAAGRPQAQRDNGTDVINEQTEMRGRPALPGAAGASALAFDSIASVSDITRRGLTAPFNTITGTHRVLAASRLISGRDTTRQLIQGTSEWRALRYPRSPEQFRPVSVGTFPPGMNFDSLTAVVRLSGPWAVGGERVDETINTRNGPIAPGTSRQRTVLTYESADAARVLQTTSTSSGERTSTCRVDRLSFSAVCQTP